MLKIRKGIFETNSSSTHSITMCTMSQYDQWKNGEMYWARWDSKFITKDEVEEKIAGAKEKYFTAATYSSEADFRDDFLKNEGYYTFDDYCDYLEDYYYETFYDELTTPSGEKVVAFGYFGYDG